MRLCRHCHVIVLCLGIDTFRYYRGPIVTWSRARPPFFYETIRAVFIYAFFRRWMSQTSRQERRGFANSRLRTHTRMHGPCLTRVARFLPATSMKDQIGRFVITDNCGLEHFMPPEALRSSAYRGPPLICAHPKSWTSFMRLSLSVMS